MIIMDTGGYPAYYGNPVEAVTYFKKATHQVDSNRGQCETCGNVNPEQIFNIIEAKVVDEYGQPTNKRKVTPMQWHEMYGTNFKLSRTEDINEEPPKTLNLPGRIKQTLIFTWRDLLSKVSNKQYLLINLLEAPLLALILTFIIRYRSSPGGDSYSFRFNENIPAFLLMAIIVALFMGLTVSAEEIIRDRKILKRESFLNLSWSSYLFSKVAILFTLSAIQTLLFVVVGNLILEIHGMTWAFWLVLFSTSCLANVLGLNISSAFNSAVTVYVMIPLLLIPQMILSGLLFSFDKLNDLISTKGKVPIVADLMASRWAYEAIATYQFVNNEYEEPFYEYERKQSLADFKAAFLSDELKRRNEFLSENYQSENDSIKALVVYNHSLIARKLSKDPYFRDKADPKLIGAMELSAYNSDGAKAISAFLDDYKKYYQGIYNDQTALLEKKMTFYEKNGWSVNENKNRYYNESLADLIKNVTVKDRLLEYNGDLIQQIDPIFQEPEPANALDYRTAFFLPEKNFSGFVISSFWFDTAVIWLMSTLLFITLYFEVIRKFVDSFDKINFLPKK